MNEGLKISPKAFGRLGHWLRPSIVIQYLKDHESTEGGFSFVLDLFPNIEDTYYAVRTFQLLKVNIDRNKIANYLKSINFEEVGFPRIIYMSFYLHISLGIELPPQLNQLLRVDWNRFPVIDAYYYSDNIQKLLNKPLKSLTSSSPFQFHPQDNLQRLQKKVSVLLGHGIDFNRHEIIRWVQLCQNGDGGFGFYPITTSYMDNTYCALEVLSKLHASPMRIDTCREYILGCQTKSGGFGRAPMSFPFIESTYQAVVGLFILDEMEGGST
jgi:hypothetical protein